MIYKGYISAILDGGKKATVVPAFSSNAVSHELTVHFTLLECLEIGMAVVCCGFPDNTGMVLARLDGEWNHKIWDGVQIVTGNTEIVAGDLVTGQVSSYNGHTHTCPDGSTGAPN